MAWPAGIPVAAAPWKLEGEVYTFVLPPVKEVPAGAYAPLEAQNAEEGTFIGGPGALVLIRYRKIEPDSVPVYDELIYGPGRYTYKGKTGLRVTRIYVSDPVTLVNGRKNWAIPKYLADFDIKYDEAQKTTAVRISEPGADQPFLAIKIQRPSVFTSLAVPISTKISMGLFRFVQPPLPPLGGVLIGTDGDGHEMEPTMAGGTRLATLLTDVKDGKIGDGVSLPVLAPYTKGLYQPHCRLSFPVGSKL